MSDQQSFRAIQENFKKLCIDLEAGDNDDMTPANNDRLMGDISINKELISPSVQNHYAMSSSHLNALGYSHKNDAISQHT